MQLGTFSEDSFGSNPKPLENLKLKPFLQIQCAFLLCTEIETAFKKRDGLPPNFNTRQINNFLNLNIYSSLGWYF